MSKLDGIKAGDRVRPSQSTAFTGVVIFVSGSNAWVHWDHNYTHVVLKLEHLVKVPEQFNVGDEVLVLGRHRNSNETVVGFLKDGRAIVEYQAGDTSNVCAYDISCLTHA